MKTILVLLFSFLISCLGDDPLRENISNFVFQNNDFLITNTFDWDVFCRSREDWPSKYRNDFFSKNNTYGSLECIDKKSGNRLFSIPFSSVDYIYISPQKKYITTLSSIKLADNCSMVILDFSGKIVFKQWISSHYSLLSLDELKEFTRLFPTSKIPESKVVIQDGKVYINYLSLGLADLTSEKAIEYLYQHETELPFMKNITETVTNYIFWYAEDPKIKLNTIDDKLFNLSLLDPKGRRIVFPIAYRGIPYVEQQTPEIRLRRLESH